MMDHTDRQSAMADRFADDYAQCCAAVVTSFKGVTRTDRCETHEERHIMTTCHACGEFVCEEHSAECFDCGELFCPTCYTPNGSRCIECHDQHEHDQQENGPPDR